MQRALRIYDAILKCAAMAGAFLLALTVVVTVADVTVRPFGWQFFYWQVDFVELALLNSTFLIAPWILALGAHVQVDIAVAALPMRVARVIGVLANLWGAALCVLLGVIAAQEVLGTAARGSLYIRSFVIPEWWVLVCIPCCFAAMSVEFLLRSAGLRRARQHIAI